MRFLDLASISRRVRVIRCYPLVPIFAFGIFGCAHDISGANQRLEVTADTSLLTPDVARSLKSGGLFALSTPGPDVRDELSEPQVRAIARAWVRQGFPWVQGRLEGQHGSAIDRANLRDCARVYYAESPYETLQDSSDGGVARRAYGPWWLVPLCVGGDPKVLLGIAAFADIHLENGEIRFSHHPGTEFVWRGIPGAASVPMSPEAAANAVARASGAKIASVPRLILPNFREGSPAAARWEIAISPATIVTSHGQRPTSTTSLFIGPLGPGPLQLTELQRASADQPNEVQIRLYNPATHTVDHIGVLRRKSNLAVRFEPADVNRP